MTGETDIDRAQTLSASRRGARGLRRQIGRGVQEVTIVAGGARLERGLPSCERREPAFMGVGFF